MLFAERRIIARLRRRRFFSLEEVRFAVWAELTRLNERRFQKLDGSRRSLFLTEELPALRPLPERPYAWSWDRREAPSAMAQGLT